VHAAPRSSKLDLAFSKTTPTTGDYSYRGSVHSAGLEGGWKVNSFISRRLLRAETPSFARMSLRAEAAQRALGGLVPQRERHCAGGDVERERVLPAPGERLLVLDLGGEDARPVHAQGAHVAVAEHLLEARLGRDVRAHEKRVEVAREREEHGPGAVRVGEFVQGGALGQVGLPREAVAALHAHGEAGRHDEALDDGVDACGPARHVAGLRLVDVVAPALGVELDEHAEDAGARLLKVEAAAQLAEENDQQLAQVVREQQGLLEEHALGAARAAQAIAVGGREERAQRVRRAHRAQTLERGGHVVFKVRGIGERVVARQALPQCEAGDIETGSGLTVGPATPGCTCATPVD
jgi:hypothetical protein